MISASIAKKLLPQDCSLCGGKAYGSLCAPCFGGLPARAGAACPSCDEASAAGHLCGACLAHPPHFDATVSAFDYAFPLDRLLQSYKFHANLALTELFADALVKAVAARQIAKPDLLVPLPLAPKRLAERGFNQSALLASEIGKRLKVPVDLRALKRVRETAPQSGLTRDMRLKNVRRAFAWERAAKAPAIAIIDDVMTTGATLSEAAKAMKKAGAGSVYAWVVARAAHS